MDQKIMSNVDDWMKISDKVVQDPQRGKHLVVDESTISSSELIKFFMKYPEFSPLRSDAVDLFKKTKARYSCYTHLSIKDLEFDGHLSVACKQHTQILSLFAFIFEKMSALEKQNVSQQKTLDFVCKKMSALEKQNESQQKTLGIVLEKMSALEKQNEIALEKQNEIQQKTLEQMLEDECDAVFSR